MIKLIGNPINDVMEAICNLYPDVEAEIVFVASLEEHVGEITFPDDGTTPLIRISADIPLTGILETIAHEAAHAVVGRGHDHDEEWEACFDNIFKEYERIITEEESESE